jgi:hypothetical protein
VETLAGGLEGVETPPLMRGNSSEGLRRRSLLSPENFAPWSIYSLPSQNAFRFHWEQAFYFPENLEYFH